ncbi:MAG: hypothetical protein FK733_17665 [Asgard group archaeon]|nr:hypothetical protein [Asgard group archaeon]
MTSQIKDELSLIKKHLLHSSYEDGLKLIENTLKEKKLTKEEILTLNNHKCDILNHLGRGDEVSNIADKVLKESKSLTNISIYVEALMQKASSEFYLGNLRESQSLCEEALQLIEKRIDKNKTNYYTQKAYLYEIYSLVVWVIEGIEKGMKLRKDGMDIAEKSDDPRLTLRYKNSKVYYLFYQKKYEEALLLGKETIEESLELGNRFILANSYLFVSYIHIELKEFEKSIDNLLEAKKYAEELNHEAMLTIIYNYLGKIYFDFMKLDEAISYYKKITKMGLLKYEGFARLGICYFWKNQIDKSKEYFMKAMDLSLEIGEKQVLPAIYSNLIELYIEEGNLVQAKKILSDFRKFSEASDRQVVINYYHFSQGEFLKASSKMTDWIKSIKTFEKLLKENNLNNDLRLRSLYNILSIQLRELQSTADVKKLENINKQIAILQEEAELKKYFMLKVELYRLKSQLSLLEFDVKKASNFLVTASTLAEEKGLVRLAKQIKADQDKLEKQTNMWIQYKETKTSTSEILDQLSIEKTSNEIAKETLIEIHDEESDKVIEYRKLFALKI